MAAPDAAEAVIARNLRLADLHSPPMSPVRRESRQGSEEDIDLPSSPLSTRSSYYVPSDDRSTFPAELDDAGPAPEKRSFKLLRKLWRAKRPTVEKRGSSENTTRRLESFVKFQDVKAAERMLAERSLADGRTWLIL